ncbi:uncharacterized protein LOC135211904 [Macrobrachium nipponense]|uniref:uncharacterized protein LOC135211904 n=1 Tax=Macrobrachium nipponense TaxID=159736 RepID=UPI0030C8698B
MEWEVIEQDEPEPITPEPVTPAPSVSKAVVLGATGSGCLILVLIITTAVICYRKKRQRQEKAPDDGNEFQDYEDVTNCEEIYADVMNIGACEYDNAEYIYSDPDDTYENPLHYTVRMSQGGQVVTFKPSG